MPEREKINAMERTPWDVMNQDFEHVQRRAVRARLSSGEQRDGDLLGWRDTANGRLALVEFEWQQDLGRWCRLFEVVPEGKLQML